MHPVRDSPQTPVATGTPRADPGPGPGPHSVEPDAIDGALSVLHEGHLFRYDAPSPETSPASCFEREFAEFLGARYAVATNSCSSALFLALLACGVGPGDEVLVPSFTFIAVPSAVVHAGATPVLVETTADLVMDPEDLERKISRRTTAVLSSYMRGRVPDLERVLDICRTHGLVIVEDVAHGLGVRWDGAPLGRFGRAAAFSFQSHKLLDGGEGGMLVTDDRDVALRALWQSGCYDRNWGRHFLDAEDHAWLEAAANTLPIFGLRMTNLTASILRPQLRRLPERLALYEGRYQQVVEGLASCDVRIPGHSARVAPVLDSLQFEVRSLGPAQIADFVGRCNARGVPLQVLGLDPDNSRFFGNWEFVASRDCPRTRDLLARVADVALPLWLTEPVLTHYGEAIRTSLAEAVASGS
jgi:dTDP-4-amino-4,6-dideoxygalactose transaminase